MKGKSLIRRYAWHNNKVEEKNSQSINDVFVSFWGEGDYSSMELEDLIEYFGEENAPKLQKYVKELETPCPNGSWMDWVDNNGSLVMPAHKEPVSYGGDGINRPPNKIVRYHGRAVMFFFFHDGCIIGATEIDS